MAKKWRTFDGRVVDTSWIGEKEKDVEDQGVEAEMGMGRLTREIEIAKRIAKRLGIAVAIGENSYNMLDLMETFLREMDQGLEKMNTKLLDMDYQRDLAAEGGSRQVRYGCGCPLTKRASPTYCPIHDSPIWPKSVMPIEGGSPEDRSGPAGGEITAEMLKAGQAQMMPGRVYRAMCAVRSDPS